MQQHDDDEDDGGRPTHVPGEYQQELPFAISQQLAQRQRKRSSQQKLGSFDILCFAKYGGGGGVAEGDGGKGNNVVVLRLLLDKCRGFDLETVIALA